MTLLVTFVDQETKNMEEDAVSQIDEIILGQKVCTESSEDEINTSSKNILELLDKPVEKELCKSVSYAKKWYKRSKLHIIKEYQAKHA